MLGIGSLKPGRMWFLGLSKQLPGSVKEQPTQETWKALAACIYQAAGAYDLPPRFLDALSAASRGEPFAHLIDGLLPVESPVELPKLHLAMPAYEKRRVVIASDEMIDGERFVCVAIQEGDKPTGAGPIKAADFFNGDAAMWTDANGKLKSEWHERMETMADHADTQQLLHVRTPAAKAIDIALALVAAQKPVAWWSPRLISFKNVIKTSCPTELQDEYEGTVAFSPELIGDAPAVTDKHGVTHYPRPLVFGDHAMLAQTISDYERTKKLRAAVDDSLDREGA
jgi:hypothetical protein